MQVRVRELKQGDILWPTNREVVRVSAGISTPSGKLDVDLKPAEPSGTDELPVTRSCFRADTRVSIIRNDEASYRRRRRTQRRMGMGPLRYR